MAESSLSASTVRANPSPTSPGLINSIDDVYGEVAAITHALSFLVTDLEFAFDSKRGERDGNGGITLKFTDDGTDATIWLVSEIWIRTANLKERLGRIQEGFDTEEIER